MAVATGYLYASLISISYALTFPGLFAPQGILGAGYQTAGWIYLFWHCGLPLAVIANALLKDANSAAREFYGSTRTAIGIVIAAAAVVVCGLTWIAIAGDNVLPRLFMDAVHISPFGQYCGGFVGLLSAVALAVLWIRRRSLLDLWLMVVICAWLLEIAFFVLLTPLRFNLPFYTSRLYALITASVVLLVLLAETKTLYDRVARSILKHRRDRERR